MPAVRSAKGNTDAKGKAVATRPRQHLKDNVDPCEICGVVVSRKSDIPRHAKRHASDAEKLPCPWEGCTFRTLQKSNLDTHYRRHTQDRSYNCTDDPETCRFQTCDPASLLRHRKRLHGYTPRASTGYKDDKPYKHVHVRIMRGIEADSDSVASQFSTFSSGASSSATASRPLSPLDSLSASPTPSPSPSSSPSPSRSLPRRSFSPANSSGESEVSPSPSPSTPVASTSNRELTPERSSPTVLSMTSSPVYPTGKGLLFPDSFLFAHTAKNYAWGLSLVDTPELLDESVVSSPGSELLEFQFSEEETNDQPIPEGLDSLPLPLWLPDIEKMWPGYETAGQLIGLEGLKLDKRSFKTVKIDNQVTFDMSINDSPFIQSQNLPIGVFQPSSTDLDVFGCKLEIGFECGGSGGSGELAISSTILGADANLACCNDMMNRDDSVAGDQRTETNANANVTNVDDLSSHISSNHSQWDTFVDLSVAKDEDLDGDMSLLLQS